MNTIKKRIVSVAVAAAMLSGSISALAAPSVTFTKESDGTTKATVTGISNLDRVAVAQYNQAGSLINFGISSIGGDAVTLSDFDWSPLNSTKIVTFSDWSSMKSNDTAYRIGTRTYANIDMENGTPFQIASGGHYIAVEDNIGNGGGKALHFRSSLADTGDSHATLNSLLSPISDFMVYEFDVKLVSAASHFRAYLRGVKNDGSTGESEDILYVYPNTTAGATTASAKLGGQDVTLSADVYYTVTAVVNYKDRTKTVTLTDASGTVVKTLTTAMTSKIGYNSGQDKPCSLRIHTASRYWTPSTVSHDFYIDNIKVYEGTQARSDLNGIAYIVDTSDTVSVFESEDTEITKLKGTLSVHSRSGVAYNGTSKTHLEKTPYTENGEVYVPLNELCKAWGVTVTGVTTDKDGYAKLSDIASKLGKTLYIDKKASYNNGLCVLGSNFTFPANADDLQELNDFVFYMRPTQEQIKSAYNESATKGTHPRIMATKSDFDRVKAEYKNGNNTVFMNWANSVIREADKMCSYEKGTPEYEARWGYKVTDGYITTSTEWLPLAATAMAMSYQLTGETSYLDKLYEILQYVGDYTDWAPTHHLSPPRIAMGYIIAYDWAYDGWTAEQRKYIEETVYEKFFYEVAQAYQSGGSTLNNAAIATNNHNIVFNSAVALAGMAFMEAYPEECTYLIKNAVRGSDLMLWHWAPNGSWYEGVDYWNLTMEYTVYMLSSLQSTFGTMFGYENLEGLKDAADYTIYSQTQNGPHNYSDCTADHFTIGLYTPEMMWLSKTYDNDGWTQAVIKYLPNELMYVSDSALGLLWYDTSITSTNIDLPYDAIYESDDVITMRNNWNQDETSSFVGIHGGATNTEHSQLDGGSFVFEQGGIRWAIDPGKENYNVPNYWVTTYSSTSANRWRYFRSTAGAHNTVEIEPSAAYTSHDLSSYVDVKLVESGDNGAIATANMTQALSRYATKATRGFYYTDNRESLVIRDEISLKASADNTNYIKNYTFDGVTSTDALGKETGQSGNYEIVSGTGYGLNAGDDVAKLTGKNLYFAGNQWGADLGVKHATYEFELYTENEKNKLQFYPTRYNRYGLQVGGDANGTVMAMTPSWSTASISGSPEMAKGGWHKFAIEYDMTNGKMLIYMDKTLIHTQTGLTTTDNVPADIGFHYSSGAANTNILINNLKCYEGGYKDVQSGGTASEAEKYDIYWYLLTGEDNDNTWTNFDDIDVTIADNGKSATLTHRLTNKQMKLEYAVDGGEAVLSVADAETIRQQMIKDGILYDTSSQNDTNKSKTESHKNRITLKVTGSGDVAITVKLTPVGLANATPISDYTGAISTWSLD